MKALALLLLLAAAPAWAQTTIITLGRLFTTPVERTQLDQQRNSTDPTALLDGRAPMTPPAPPPPPPPMAAPAAEAPAPAPPPEALELNGVLRRSNGKTIVWVNREARDSAPSVRGQGVPLQHEGRRILLKPGQSYDPATGTIQESGR